MPLRCSNLRKYYGEKISSMILVSVHPDARAPSVQRVPLKVGFKLI